MSPCHLTTITTRQVLEAMDKGGGQLSFDEAQKFGLALRYRHRFDKTTKTYTLSFIVLKPYRNYKPEKLEKKYIKIKYPIKIGKLFICCIMYSS